MTKELYHVYATAQYVAIRSQPAAVPGGKTLTEAWQLATKAAGWEKR